MMWGYGFSGSGILMMSLGIIVVVVLIWALVRGFSRQNTNAIPQPQAPSATETLRQRYARGEIDAKTYEQMSSQLQMHENEPIQGVR